MRTHRAEGSTVEFEGRAEKETEKVVLLFDIRGSHPPRIDEQNEGRLPPQNARFAGSEVEGALNSYCGVHGCTSSNLPPGPKKSQVQLHCQCYR
jgi:hypothetical protein